MTNADYTCIIKGEGDLPDDGVTIDVTDSNDCQGPYCPDCGGGPLVWHEAGHVPWHRLCTRCGSHWDARSHAMTGKTIAELNARPNERRYEVRRARFHS